jgi:hypothetical protein
VEVAFMALALAALRPRRRPGLPACAPGQSSHGIELAATPAHTALELEEQECVLELRVGQGTLVEKKVGAPVAAAAHDVKQEQSVFVQHPKVGRANGGGCVAIRRLALWPRGRWWFRSPKVGRGDVVEVVFMGLPLSRRRGWGAFAIGGVADSLPVRRGAFAIEGVPLSARGRRDASVVR